MSTLIGPAGRPATSARATSATGQRLELAVAGVLLAAAAAATTGTLWLLEAVDPNPVALTAVLVALLSAGAAGGLVTPVRRTAGRILGLAAALAALAAAGLLGLAVVILLLGRLPHAAERSLVAPALLGAGAAAVAFEPMRTQLRGLTRWSTAGLRRSPDSVIEAFGERGTRDVPVEELLRQLAESLRESLGLATVEMWTGDNTGLTRLLSVPHRAAATSALGADACAVLLRAGVAGEAWLSMWVPALLIGRGDAPVLVAPVAHGSDLLGLIVAEREREAGARSTADERLLGELARRLGVVLHNRALDTALQASLDDLRRTNEELRASRLRLVSAADAERRRIERDIHDGAQQHLAALAVNIGLARQLLAGGDEARSEVAPLLQDLAADVRTAIEEVRNLAHGIYPPLLRQSGLAAALTAAAARAPVPVTVHLAAGDGDDGTGTDGRESANVEAAMYFCALEALQNVVKHAPGATAVLRLTVTPGGLTLEVTDDGPGFDPVVRGGQGLQNMTDRLGAVGGRVHWATGPGQGTRLVATVPRTGGGQ